MAQTIVGLLLFFAVLIFGVHWSKNLDQIIAEQKNISVSISGLASSTSPKIIGNPTSCPVVPVPVQPKPTIRKPAPKPVVKP